MTGFGLVRWRTAAARARAAGAVNVDTRAVKGAPVDVLDHAVAESGAELLAQRKGLLGSGVGLGAFRLGAPLRLLGAAGASRGGRHLLGRLARHGFDL